MNESKYERGMQVRREVLGDAHVNRAEANKTSFDENFQRLIVESAWGTVWAGEGLDRKTRHLVTLALLAALGQEHEFGMHMRATRNTGVSQEEVREALHHVAIYAGVPAANSAFAIAKQFYSEQERRDE
jgi:4-carboxymuconolactone decarboxylase